MRLTLSMLKRPWVIALAVLAILFGVFVAATWPVALMFLPSRIGAIAETWETSNGSFRIRVDAHLEENGGFVPGAYYVFWSAPPGSDRWSKVMTFRHDDPIPIRRNQVRFVNDQVAFAYMGWMFASTADAGATWSVWDARTDSPKWCCNYELIEDVRLEPDGTGTMTLKPVQNPRGEKPELRTKDYGRHWGT